MEVVVTAAKCDQGTAHIADIMSSHLERLGRALTGDYGGQMKHLWIDLELSPGDADRRDPFFFRFQKRVALGRRLKVIKRIEYFDVGHYSVRPDYFALAQIALCDVPCYLMNLLFDSTLTLSKRRQIQGFNIAEFRSKFAAVLRDSGCTACTANKAMQSTCEDARA